MLHQLRQSVAAARDDGGLDPIARTALHARDCRAGRRARSWRQGPAPSIADVALAADRASVRTGPRSPRPGRGRRGDGSADGPSSRGSRAPACRSRAGPPSGPLRSRPRSARRPVPFDPGPGIGDVAAIVVALRGPWLIAPSTVDALAASPAVVVDLSVPPAVPGRWLTGSVRGSSPATPWPDGAGRRHPRERADRPGWRSSSTRRRAEFSGWLDGRERRAAAQALAERADRRAPGRARRRCGGGCPALTRRSARSSRG